MRRLCVLGVLVAGWCAGCSTRDDPGFNPYAPRRGAVRVADEAVERAERAVNDFDTRMEFALY